MRNDFYNMRIYLWLLPFVFLSFLTTQAQISNLFTTPQVENFLKNTSRLQMDEKIAYRLSKGRLKILRARNFPRIPEWLNEKTIEQAYQAGMSCRFYYKIYFYCKTMEEDYIYDAKVQLLNSHTHHLTEEQAEAMAEAALTLANDNHEEDIPRLIEIVQTETYPLYRTRIYAARALLLMNESAVALPFLEKILADGNLMNIHDHVINTLAKGQHRDALTFLFQFMSKPENQKHDLTVIKALKFSHLIETIEKLEEMLNDLRYTKYKVHIYESLAEVALWQASQLEVSIDGIVKPPYYEQRWQQLKERIENLKKFKSKNSY